MQYIGYAPLSVSTAGGQIIDPDDVLDAVRTLALPTKVCVPIPPPGQGPEHFLRWANAELNEAESASGDIAARKGFNGSVLAKCAVECMIDWYLDHLLLDRVLRPHSGLIKKLEALESDSRLGIGVSLFDSVMFRPRNDAIHSYEAVDLREVRHSTQLANVTVRNCLRSLPPGLAPVFYGTIDLYQGRDAVQKLAERDPSQASYLKVPDIDGLYVSNIGPRGTVSVLLDRDASATRVVLLTSDGDKGAEEVRYCPVNQGFGLERLQELFRLLEAGGPRVINVTPYNSHTVVSSLRNGGVQPKPL